MTVPQSIAKDSSRPDRPLAITAPGLEALPGLRHGFFTRIGGSSGGLYDSLNCGLGSSDDSVSVIENRNRIVRHLRASDLVTVHQTHSAVAIVAELPWPKGAPPPKADAIITRTRGLAIGALTADCTPVLFADMEAGVIAAAHAGWRGAVSGVLEAAIDTMVNLGARRARIVCAIGPCINQPAYEIGPEFKDKLLSLDADNKRFFMIYPASPQARFDLPGYIENRLRLAGLEQPELVTTCTYENPDLLFSYRRSVHQQEPDYGRQISAIVLV